MFRRVLPLLLLLCAALAGCASHTERVDPTRSAETTVSFDARDIAAATNELSRSFLASPRVGGTPERPRVVTWGAVVNDTCQHLDSSALTGAITDALLESERFLFSTAVAARSSDRDALSAEARAAAPAAQRLRSPDLSLSGKLLQANVRRDNGGTRIEYLFTLRATDLATGTLLWQKNVQVVKAVAAGMPVW
ncbi:MAG: hypothetical protein ACI4YA_01295 [Candidatus Spyradenecus sp.]